MRSASERVGVVFYCTGNKESWRGARSELMMFDSYSGGRSGYTHKTVTKKIVSSSSAVVTCGLVFFHHSLIVSR